MTQYPANELFVAIEGGVVWTAEQQLECFAYAVVRGGANSMESKARSASFVLPEEIAQLVRGGMELGDADDEVGDAPCVSRVISAEDFSE